MLRDDGVALITGAGSGIGRALAVEAARRGLAVVLNGRRPAALEQTAELLPAGTVRRILVGDVTDAAARRALFLELEQRWGRLDFLVNNAGLLWAGPLALLDDATLNRLVATNLVAPLALTRDLLPLLVASGGGRVVNIGSMFGDIPYPLFAAYSATKHGMRGFSGALRRELRGRGVAVTYVAPRAVQTPALEGAASYTGPLAMAVDDPADIACRVWDGIARGADRIYPAGPERLFAWVERLLPGLVDGAIFRQLRRAGLEHVPCRAPSALSGTIQE